MDQLRNSNIRNRGGLAVFISVALTMSSPPRPDEINADLQPRFEHCRGLSDAAALMDETPAGGIDLRVRVDVTKTRAGVTTGH